jgi:hypothetical protein
VLGVGGFVFAALVVISRALVSDPNLIQETLRKHLLAVVGLPISVAVAFCLVIILEATSGKVEFKALGFEFKGASGPIVLWVLSFLALVVALRVLW